MIRNMSKLSHPMFCGKNSEPRTSLRFSFMIPKWENNWLVVWNIFYFSIIYGNVIIPTDEVHPFSEGRCTTNQQNHAINLGNHRKSWEHMGKYTIYMALFLGGLGLRFTPAQNCTFSLGMANSGYPKLLDLPQRVQDHPFQSTIQQVPRFSKCSFRNYWDWFSGKKLCGSQSLLNAAIGWKWLSFHFQPTPGWLFQKTPVVKRNKTTAQGENDLINGP